MKSIEIVIFQAVFLCGYFLNFKGYWAFSRYSWSHEQIRYGSWRSTKLRTKSDHFCVSETCRMVSDMGFTMVLWAMPTWQKSSAIEWLNVCLEGSTSQFASFGFGKLSTFCWVNIRLRWNAPLAPFCPPRFVDDEVGNRRVDLAAGVIWNSRGEDVPSSNLMEQKETKRKDCKIWYKEIWYTKISFSRCLAWLERVTSSLSSLALADSKCTPTKYNSWGLIPLVNSLPNARIMAEVVSGYVRVYFNLMMGLVMVILLFW